MPKISGLEGGIFGLKLKTFGLSIKIFGFTLPNLKIAQTLKVSLISLAWFW
jgi:hypothetical protein